MILFNGSRKRRMQGKGRGRGREWGGGGCGRGENKNVHLIVKQVFMLVDLVYSLYTVTVCVFVRLATQ